MSTDFTLNAKGREVSGKGASRRLRRLAGEIPGIVYGGKKDPQSITLVHKDVLKALENEAFYSHIVRLDIDGKSQDVVLKDLQRHPAKTAILHMDFLRISKTTALTIRVPLHFINEDACVGVKQDGGIISHTMSELEIQCLPKDLPEYIEVDVAALALGETLHISDIKLPLGVESVALNHGSDHDLPIAAVNKLKGGGSEASDNEASGDGETDSGSEG
ncbi:MAG: 50S ribosomal protein L25/general stress protein Ctc [Porticoccaceae bacterium]|nr:50S ribosomal protein L25/general stress protein Ctc [Porticoccaceae bacterium]